MSCLVAFFCALTSAQAEIAIKQRPLPIGGVSEKGRWTYHGGVMYIRKLVMSPDGTTLWAATSKGVIKLDIGREHLTRFTTLDGLADTYVTDLDIDADGAVWAATWALVGQAVAAWAAWAAPETAAFEAAVSDWAMS